MLGEKLISVSTILLALAVIGCSELRVDQLPQPTAEQLERKQRSEAQMQANGVPVSPDLPVIAGVADIRLRDESEVEQRALCLLVVAARAEGLEQMVIDDIVETYELKDYFTPQEQAFLADSEVNHDFLHLARLRYESSWALLWSLGLIESLDYPDRVANVPRMVRIMTRRDAVQFRADAKLRPVAELLDANDLVYRYHHAIHDAVDKGDLPPADLEDSVVFERHYALNWLIGYGGKGWDDASPEPQILGESSDPAAHDDEDHDH
jgi:hypothetical protein